MWKMDVAYKLLVTLAGQDEGGEMRKNYRLVVTEDQFLDAAVFLLFYAEVSVSSPPEYSIGPRRNASLSTEFTYSSPLAHDSNYGGNLESQLEVPTSNLHVGGKEGVFSRNSLNAFFNCCCSINCKVLAENDGKMEACPEDR